MEREVIEDILHEMVEIKRTILVQSKEVLTLKEAAFLLGVKQESVRRMMQRNEFPYYKPNRNAIYIKKSDLESYMLQNRTSSRSEMDSKAELIIFKK